eukprot:TRINITY_DN21862_c0_g1_i1.p2 TRINITY_DN21862_c0_g1~~TRINITY_DN21862_c0_g1_i1.p2  ORF type:complete len:414 (+),score=79.51 TRINITY_DN21862_c0_g1_i1:213-1454(+)
MQTAAKAAEALMGKDESSVGPTAPMDDSATMHAIQWQGKRNVVYSEVPRPKIAEPTDALVRVTGTTICGSDLHMYTNDMPGMEKGDIVGHEAMGVVVAAGDDVTKVKTGQRVVIAFNISCGTCAHCKRQEYTGCETTNTSRVQKALYGQKTTALFGYSHLLAGIPGCQAEYIRVPIADVNLLPVPEDVPDEKALYLSDIIPTSYHAAKDQAEVGEGRSVGIWGLGPIGLLVARWSQILGARRIIGIDCVPARLEAAKALGIDTIDFSKQKVLDEIAKLEPGGLDCGIECAGYRYTKSWLHRIERAVGLETDTSEILNEIILAMRTYGNVSIIADYAGLTNHFNIGAMMEKHLTVRGGQSPTQRNWEHCLAAIRAGEMDPSFIVTHRGTLADAPRLYREFDAKENGVIKVFLTP